MNCKVFKVLDDKGVTLFNSKWYEVTSTQNDMLCIKTLNGGKVVSLVRFHGYEGKNTEVYFNV